MPARTSVVSVNQLSKHFGKLRAVDAVSFDLAHGSITGFVGPNGAGKTTTIATMMGFLRATSGNVSLFGDPVSPWRAHRHHAQIGYIAGDMALLDNLTGRQYLAHMASLTRVNQNRQTHLIDSLGPMLSKPLRRLSRGNKQKIALIAALQHRPKLLILDEPTTGLDPLMQETFLDLIQTEAKSGTTVFMSSHILSEVTSICERVLFMRSGAIVLDQPISEIEAGSGQLVTLSAPKKTLLSLLQHRPRGISQASHSGDTLSFLYRGASDPLLKWLASQHLDSCYIQERDLDSIFHDMYQSSKEKPS